VEGTRFLLHNKSASIRGAKFKKRE
jgi:hypothetical protein